MRAAVLAEPRAFRLEQVTTPQPGPGEVRVSVEGSGACSSSLPVWEGRPWFTYPCDAGLPGHEGWGRVDAVGPGVELAKGTPVALLGERSFAQYEVVPAADAVVLPDQLDGRVFPGEAIGCAVNAFRRAGVDRGMKVAVVGVGFLGALLCRLADQAGAQVTAVSRRRFALEMAETMGAHETVTMDQVGELGEFPVVFEVAGAQEALDAASRLTDVGGRLVVAGYHQDGPRQVDLQLWNWRGIDVINAHERDGEVRRQGIRTAAEMVAAGDLDPTPLYTHTMPLDRIGDALDLLRHRPDGFMKALVMA